MSDEEQYEDYSEESTEGAAEGQHHGHTDAGSHYFGHKRGGLDKAMLVSWGIAVASAAFMILLAGLIVIAIMEEEEEPIEYAIAPAMVADDMEEEVKQKKQKQMEKSSSSSSMTSPIVIDAVADITMETVQMNFDQGDDGVQIGQVGNAVGDLGLGQDMGGMTMNIKMPKLMGSRCDKADRMRRLKREGGKEKTEEAVIKGLQWLKTVQNADGSWGAQYQPSMTGLALLSFLGHCEKQDSPDYGDTVMKAIKYLLEKNETQGGKMYASKPAYETGICAYALGESYIVTKNFRPKIEGIDKALERSIEVIVTRQKADGGWDYGYSTAMTKPSDTSVSGWQIQALKVAKLTGLEIKGVSEAMDKAMENIMRVRGPKGGFGYRDPQDKVSLSGVGVLAMQMWDPKKFKKEIDMGVEFILDSHPGRHEKPHFNMYGWYYHTQACFQAGGRAWKDWNTYFQDEVVDHQSPDGSWTDWGAHGHGPDSASITGKVYTTSLCILMLEIYYRYLQNTGDDKYRKGATGLKSS
jgi:hypothetical protein